MPRHPHTLDMVYQKVVLRSDAAPLLGSLVAIYCDAAASDPTRFNARVRR